MKYTSWLRVALLSALTGGVIGITCFLFLDWIVPGSISIDPGEPREITVVIDGAVATPGLAVIPSGSRLQAVIDAAGGLTSEADATGLNLAGRVGDGEHITIPDRRLDQPVPSASGTPGMTAVPGLIHINTADVFKLDELPGVGLVIAQRIVDYRVLNGEFESIGQLAEIEGISPQMVEEIAPLVTVDD